MRILFLGDIVGRSGRDALIQYMPFLKEKLAPDVIIVNGDNAASGHGVTFKLAQEILGYGIDCLTNGNHVWAQKDFYGSIDRDPRCLRPINFPEGTPGKGTYRHTLADGRTIMIVNIMGNAFMDVILEDPFIAAKKMLSSCRLGTSDNAIFIDFHAEATAEKMALAHYLDGQVSALIGTHTHIPTADMQILPKGTAFQADAGMCGDFNSVIGSETENVLHRHLKKLRGPRFEPAKGEATICGTFIVTDDKTGKALSIDDVRHGGRLQQKMPDQ